MMGFQIYERRSVLVDDFDPDETRVTKEFPVSPVYLSEDKAKEEMKRLESVPERYHGDPISCYSYSEGYHIVPVGIVE